MHQFYTPNRPTAIPNFAKICLCELNGACMQNYWSEVLMTQQNSYGLSEPLEEFWF